jgi:hypothetical protein
MTIKKNKKSIKKKVVVKKNTQRKVKKNNKKRKKSKKKKMKGGHDEYSEYIKFLANEINVHIDFDEGEFTVDKKKKMKNLIINAIQIFAKTLITSEILITNEGSDNILPPDMYNNEEIIVNHFFDKIYVLDQHEENRKKQIALLIFEMIFDDEIKNLEKKNYSGVILAIIKNHFDLETKGSVIYPLNDIIDKKELETIIVRYKER